MTEAPKLSTPKKAEATTPKPSAPAGTAKAPVGEPLTPKEKVEAITTAKYQTSSSKGKKAPISKPNLNHNIAGGCFSIDLRASKAPAKQDLALRHGKSKFRSRASQRKHVPS